MRHCILLTALSVLVLSSCEQASKAQVSEPDKIAEPAATPADPKQSVIRINSTRQKWNPGQPWEKQPPRKRRSLAAVVGDGQFITTSEMVADATMIELESIDGKKLAQGKVIAVDYEANLALIGLDDPEADASFSEGLVPLEIAEPFGLGDSVEAIQVEENGTLLVTRGPVQSIDIVANFLPGEYFLTYEVKASMQSAASSFSVPALHDGKLAGLLTSYNSKDQISDITGTEILSRFLEDAADGDYQGFPSLGVSTARTEDAGFRSWLKLSDDVGGLYIAKVRKGSAAEAAELKKGDVITVVDGHDIDRMGYFEHPIYGRTYWSHLVRGAKGAGESVTLGILRDGETLELNVELERRDRQNELVPGYLFGKAPNFLVKGGFIFQELTRPLLESFGDEWESRAPLNLLDVLENPDKYEDRYERVVFLAGVIATPATVGYEPLRNLIVTEVNGKPVRDMKSLIAAFDDVPGDGLHSIEFDEENFKVYLDEVVSTQVDGELLQRGLSKLSRSE
ncbi:PDZ domain-containing protein [Haloferula chungangensis]|uniref:PDZ domain-containing protein n=1 Tax=Haloferula chungangensis TaxID=1048331 RepID=A0ABW2LC68_9BACT